MFAIIVIPRIVKIKIVSDKTKNEFESNEVKLQFQKQDANDGRTYFWLSTIGWFNGQAQYIFLSTFSQQGTPLGVGDVAGKPYYMTKGLFGNLFSMVSAEMISKKSGERKLFTQIIFEISIVLALLGFIIQDFLLDQVYYWWLGDSVIMDYMLYVRLFVFSVLLNVSIGLIYRHYLYIKTDKKQLVFLDLLCFQ